ncbi:MAG: site-2 protease family protein [Clostridia bacterium]|jgi:Zn-dependent protease|nr:site-2 protease family protein [Clostridia bacterium]
MNLVNYITFIPAILVAITFHEYAHGKTAALLGDPTPGSQGRLTLNPLAHLDFLGTLMLLTVHFGWAKPVQVNPVYFRGDRRKGLLLVSLSGPLMNLVLAYLAAFAWRLTPSSSPMLATFFAQLLWINVALALFNLIPVPPLDGSKILANLLPRSSAMFFYQLESYGPLILLLLLVTGLVGKILAPAIDFTLEAITTLAGI